MEILVFTSSNCSYCPKAERVLKAVALDYLEKRLSHKKIRTKTPEGKELSIRYRVMGTPTILFLDDNESELKRIV